MSAQADLRAVANGTPPEPTTDDFAAALTELLDTKQIGRRATSASVFGRGPNALVTVHLDNGEQIRIDRFGDVSKPAVLSSILMTTLGVYRVFKTPEALQVGVLIHKLAEHANANEEANLFRGFGEEYLRLAHTHDVDMNDRQSRWRAFEELAAQDPSREAGVDRSGHALACAATILRDETTGTRYIRSGWFQAFVRREIGGVSSPALLTQEMLSLGWTKLNSQGRVKVTHPTDASRTLQFRFYCASDDWEHEDGLPPVTGSSLACAHTRAGSEVTGGNPVTRLGRQA